MGAKKPIRTFDEQQAVSSWAVAGTAATNAAATATKAAETQVTHYLTHVEASYGAAAIGLLEVKDGTTVILRRHVHNSASINLAKPIEITKGALVSATLAAGGAGVDGVASIAGHSI